MTSTLPAARSIVGPETPRWLVGVDPRQLPRRVVDVLVIGGGVAGLSAAVTAAEHADTLVLLKGARGETATSWAQGGMAVVWGADDSAELHAQDTVKCAAGLAEPDVVSSIVSESRGVLERWIEWGGRFDLDGDRIALSREAGHSVHRIVHANGDQTGAEIQRLLIERAGTLARLKVLEQVFVLDLVTEDGEVRGALAWAANEGFFAVFAGTTILATGGIGRLYRESTNPKAATGDGLAMAYRAGARLRNLEFVQFHPTVLYVAGMTRFLVSETARGEGGILVDRTGHRFMPEYHEDAELAPRDVVSRAIVRQLAKVRDSSVYLDLRHLPAERIRARFPVILRACEEFGIDMTSDLVPVHPACHYMVGGVVTDTKGRTSLRGLLACGEVASTGLHGANRMGSNSLLEGAVMGYKAGAGAVASGRVPIVGHDGATAEPRGLGGPIDLEDLEVSLRALMWRLVGIERDGQGLGAARRKLSTWQHVVDNRTFGTPPGWQLSNRILLGLLIAQAATTRTESRGCHFRRDHPELDDEHWRLDLVMTKPDDA